MAQVRLFGGKPLLIGGKVALSDNCCCSPGQFCANCALPSGNCPHAICAEFKIESNDNSDQDLIELVNASDQMGFYHSGGNWNLYVGAFSSSSIPAVNPFGIYHNLRIRITYLGSDMIRVAWDIDGVSSTFDASWSVCYGTALKVGAIFGSGDAHRSFRCVSVLGNPSSPTPPENDFAFPASSFDSLRGGASIVAGELRIDSPGGTDAYGEKDFSPGYNLKCCFECDGTIFARVNATANVSGSCGNMTISTAAPAIISSDISISSEGTPPDSTAVVCEGSFNFSDGGGAIHVVCPGGSGNFNFFINVFIGRVLTAGTISGTPFNVGDWFALIGSFSYDFGGTFGCDACPGSLVATSAHLIPAGVPNTIELSAGGITTTIDLSFTIVL